MLLLKRLATLLALFVVLFVVVYFAICFIGGAVSGGMAGAGNLNPKDAAAAGRKAGAAFVKENMKAIFVGSCVVSIAVSAGLSFSRVLPWCRKPSAPPPLPPPPGL